MCAAETQRSCMDYCIRVVLHASYSRHGHTCPACCSPAMPRQPVTSPCAAAAVAHDGNEVQAMMDILVQRQDEKKVSFDPNKLFDFADDNVLAPGALCQAAACALLMWLPDRLKTVSCASASSPECTCLSHLCHSCVRRPLVPTTSKFAADAVAIADTPTRARSYRGVLFCLRRWRRPDAATEQQAERHIHAAVGRARRRPGVGRIRGPGVRQAPRQVLAASKTSRRSNVAWSSASSKEDFVVFLAFHFWWKVFAQCC